MLSYSSILDLCKTENLQTKSRMILQQGLVLDSCETENLQTLTKRVMRLEIVLDPCKFENLQTLKIKENPQYSGFFHATLQKKLTFT